MAAQVPSLPYQVVKPALDDSMKIAALPYASELRPFVKTANYLIGHGYPIVPAIFLPEETLSEEVEYQWDFGIIPRDNESSTVISVNRIHFIKIKGDEGDIGTIWVKHGATEAYFTNYVVGKDSFNNTYWAGYIIQPLTYTQIDEYVTLTITPSVGEVVLESYACFEMPRYQLNPISAARGTDENSTIKGCSIFTGTTNKSCNQLFNEDPRIAGRRVLFNWAAEMVLE